MDDTAALHALHASAILQCIIEQKEQIANGFVDFESMKCGKIDIRLIYRATHKLSQAANGHKMHACMHFYVYAERQKKKTETRSDDKKILTEISKRKLVKKYKRFASCA